MTVLQTRAAGSAASRRVCRLARATVGVRPPSLTSSVLARVSRTWPDSTM